MRDAGRRTPDIGHRTAKKAKIIYPPPRGVDIILRFFVNIDPGDNFRLDNVPGCNALVFFLPLAPAPGYALHMDQQIAPVLAA